MNGVIIQIALYLVGEKLQKIKTNTKENKTMKNQERTEWKH